MVETNHEDLEDQLIYYLEDILADKENWKTLENKTRNKEVKIEQISMA